MSSGKTLELAIELFGFSRHFAQAVMDHLVDRFIELHIYVKCLEVYYIKEIDPDLSMNSRMIRGVVIGTSVDQVLSLIEEYMSFPSDDLFVCDLLQSPVECRS